MFENSIEAIKKAGYEPGKDVCLALDCASTEMYDEAKKVGKDGYLFWKTGEFKTKEQMIDFIVDLAKLEATNGSSPGPSTTLPHRGSLDISTIGENVQCTLS